MEHRTNQRNPYRLSQEMLDRLYSAASDPTETRERVRAIEALAPPPKVDISVEEALQLIESARTKWSQMRQPSVD